MKTHKDLLAWKNSINLVTDIYKLTESFPKEELYGLTNQLRRCAVSVPSNIAEGAGRNSKKEYVQFLYISLGSLSELETQLIISQNLAFIKEEKLDVLKGKLNEIRSQISGLIRYLKGNKVTGRQGG
jgi:four helix bundle protein